MKNVRILLENLYPLWKNYCFFSDAGGEKSHQAMVKWSQRLHKLRLTKLVLEDKNLKTPFLLSNAAGWDKDAQIPEDFFFHLGFQRIVLGSITSKAHLGNSCFPRIKRLPQENSLLNWLGLPNIGAESLAKKLQKQKRKIPFTLNLAPLPTAKSPSQDLIKSMEILKNFGDRWEINISCPNTHQTHQQELFEIVSKVSKNNFNKELFLKLSPDWDIPNLKKFLAICSQNKITGFVVGNSSLKHSYQPHPKYKGGLSGETLFDSSYSFLKKLYQEIQKNYQKKNWKIIACGGISKKEQILDYSRNFGIQEFQLYTAIIYQGPKLFRNLKNGN